jgi:4,5-DOPA dioxygenase extradiol
MTTISGKTMPAVFIGHGNPMNVVRSNRWTSAWTALGNSMPRPKAILAISAHWYIPGTKVTASAKPPTIYDFGGFPKELYEKEYPAPGDPALAQRVKELLAPIDVELDNEWGLDHGTWSVLYHIYPKADIPVVQLSIDITKPASYHYEIGKALATLREEGILIFGSGNIVHNLQAYSWDRPEQGAFDWAATFEEKVLSLITSGNDTSLIDYRGIGPEARLAVPSPDHYLPLLYVLGSRVQGDIVSFPVDGFEGGSLSMLAVKVG